MDNVPFYGEQVFPYKDFDHKLHVRAERHEHLRGRNNVTSCRSPTREFDTRQIKNELKEKRHKEFLRRRSVSPEAKGENQRRPSSKTVSVACYSSSHRSHSLHTYTKDSYTAGYRRMVVTPTTLTSFTDVTPMWLEQGPSWKQVSTTTQAEKTSRRTAQNANTKYSIQDVKISEIFAGQTDKFQQKKLLRDASAQTESGLLTVKESEVKQLAEYLQEALWRENTLRQKLAALQESSTNLTNSSKNIWTARCTEDLLKNKIKGLEAQLQVCLQKFPKDGVKKLVLKMEKQKMLYEEKALIALQRATQEKTDAVSEAAELQNALKAAKVDALRWRSLYEELKLSCGQLSEHKHLSINQLQQLQSQIELSAAREAELTELVLSLKEEKAKLQYCIGLLEKDNQIFRNEIQQLRDGSNGSQDLVMQSFLTSEEAEPRQTVRRESQVEEQLHYTQEKLRLKEKECEELQTELHAMEQECQSSQARLSQCRDELRQLSLRRRKRRVPCVSWWNVFLFFLLLLTITGVAMLWLWHPPFREQAEDFYSDIQTRIEDYLMQMAAPEHSGCFRPV